MEKATLTLSIPKKLKEEIREIKEVNWSAKTTRFLEEEVKRWRFLKKLDELTKHSELTEEDAVRIGRRVNEEVSKRLRMYFRT